MDNLADEQQQMNEYLQEILSAVYESGADLGKDDPGYPEIVITDQLPEGVGAQYQPEDPHNAEVKIFVQVDAVRRAMKSNKPFELVNSFVHERRHFKQDCADALDKDALPPPKSLLMTIVQEVDAYAYTAGVMDKLAKNECFAWLVVRDETHPTLSASAQEIYEQGKQQGMDGGKAVARTLLYGTQGGFAWQYVSHDLNSKHAQLVDLRSVINEKDVKKLCVPANSWLMKMQEEVSENSIPSFLQETGFLANDDGTHDWLMDNGFVAEVLETYAQESDKMLDSLREVHAQIASVLVSDASRSIEPSTLGNRSPD